MISTVYKFDFFLGIKNTKLEIRNAVFDETKQKLNHSIFIQFSLQSRSTEAKMKVLKPMVCYIINQHEPLISSRTFFLTTMLFPICSELFQNSDAFIEATSSGQ